MVDLSNVHPGMEVVIEDDLRSLDSKSDVGVVSDMCDFEGQIVQVASVRRSGGCTYIKIKEDGNAFKWDGVLIKEIFLGYPDVEFDAASDDDLKGLFEI